MKLLSSLNSPKIVATLDRDQLGEYRNALKMYCYLISRHLFTIDKRVTNISQKSTLDALSKGAGGGKKGKKKEDDGVFSYKTHVLASLTCLVEAIECDYSRLWNMGMPEEEFVALFPQVAYQLLTSTVNAKDSDTLECLHKLISIPLSRFSSQTLASSTAANLFQFVNNYEHSTVPVVTLAESMIKDENKQGNSIAVIHELLREIGRTVMKDGKDTAGAKNIAAFVEQLSVQCPSLLLANMSTLLNHLDNDSYIMRNAIITSASYIIRYIAICSKENSGENAASEDTLSGSGINDMVKTRQSLMNILTERVYDINAFSRCKALKGLALLVEEQLIDDVNLFISITSLAVGRLADKAALVRKHAIQLLIASLENNPFGSVLSQGPVELRIKDLGDWLAAHPQVEEELAQSMKEMKLGGDQVGDVIIEEEEDSKTGLESKEGCDDKETDIVNIAVKALSLSEKGAERADQIRLLKFYRNFFHFVQLLDDGILSLCSLLGSNNNTDVLESLRFLSKVILLAVIQIKCCYY